MQSGLGFVEDPHETFIDEVPIVSDASSSSNQSVSPVDESALSSQEGKRSRRSSLINHTERKEPKAAVPRVPEKL